MAANDQNPGLGVVALPSQTGVNPENNKGSAAYYAGLDAMTPTEEHAAGQQANAASLKQTQAEGLDAAGLQPQGTSIWQDYANEFSSPSGFMNNEWAGLKGLGKAAGATAETAYGYAGNIGSAVEAPFEGKNPFSTLANESWSLSGAHRAGAVDLAATLNLPGIKQTSQALGWGWQHVVNDVAARALLTVSDGINSNDWSWQDAANFQNSAHLDVGQSIAAAVTHPFGVWSTTQDLENLKQNSGAFNIASLAGNIGMAWADPMVMAPKIARLAADASSLTGKLAEVQDATAHTRVIPLPLIGHIMQHGEKSLLDIQKAALTSPDAATWATRAADAQAAAKGLGNITTKLRIMQANSLYTRLQQLKVLANVVDAHTFSQLSTFRNSVSGTAFAMAMHQALRAGNDMAVNQLVRLGLGDISALDELRATSADLEDKIRVASGTPNLKAFDAEAQGAFDRYDAVKQEALAAGKSQAEAEYEAQMSLHEKPGEDYTQAAVQRHIADMAAKRQAAEQELAGYQGYADWIRKVTPSEGDAGELAANSFFGGLTTLGSKMEYERAARRYTKFEDNKVFDVDGHTPADRGGSIRTFAATPWSTAHRVINWGEKQWLHRVGAVDLTDLDGMMHVVNHYMDQIETLTGVKSPNARAQVLSDLYNAKSELAKGAVLTKLEREAQTLILKKHGVSDESAKALASYFEAKKGASMAYLMSNAYSVTKDTSAFKIMDDWGNPVDLNMPVSVAQLKNHHILTNLTDFEREVLDRKPSLAAWDEHAQNELRLSDNPGAGWGDAQSWAAHMRHFTNKNMDGFNTLWKPLTLLSTRWPAKMGQDEAVRIALKVGGMRYLKEIFDGSLTGTVSGLKTGTKAAQDKWFGKSKYEAALADEGLQGPMRSEAFDERVIDKQGNAIPADALAKINFSAARQRRIEELVGLNRTDTVPLGKKSSVVFDPFSGKPAEKGGLVVSPYRGVRETLGARPTAGQVNRFMLRHSNVLADKTAKVAVWLDKESGRWVMDVVHHFAKSEAQAAADHAAKFGANELMDTAAGFKKYFADAPHDEHIPDGSLFPATAPKPEPLSLYGSEHTPARNLPVTTPMSWKGSGRRSVAFRDGNGAKFKATGMLQTPAGEYNYNHYTTLLQAGPTWRHILGDTEFNFNDELAGANQDHYRVVQPEDPNWSKFYAYNINRVIRHDPVSRRLLSGQTYGEVANWLEHTAEGRNVMLRLGTNGSSAIRLARMHGAIVKTLMPSHMDELHSIVAQREITVKDVERLFPKDSLDRMEINGDDALAGVHQKIHGGMIAHFRAGVQTLMSELSTVPHEMLARNPFASIIYKQHMRSFFRANPEIDAFSESGKAAIDAAAATARAKALKGVRDYLMNNTDERQLAHVTRYLFPFYGAKLEIMEKYLRLGMQNPENFERMNLLMSKSPYWGGNLWSVQDANGNTIDENSPQAGYSGNNSLVIGTNSLVYRGLVNLLGEKYARHMVQKIPMNQVDGTFRGENPLAPPIGLPVQFLSQEAFFNQHPQLEDQGIYKKLHETLFPYGDPKNQFTQLGMAGQALSDLTPAWIKRTLEASGVIDRMSDPAWNSLVVRNYMDAQYAWETGGRQGPAPTAAEAVSQANSQYAVRGVMGAALPFFGTQQSEYEGLLDMYRSLRELPGVAAMSESQINHQFADKLVQQWEAGGEKGAKPSYGSDQFWADYLFVHEASTTGSGINASDDAWNKFIQNKGLIEAATQAAPGDASKAGGLSPIAAILSGSTAAGNNYTYSPGVEAALGRTKVLPDSPQTYTTANDPQLEIQKAFIDRAWAQYMDLSQSRDAVLRQRAAAGLSGNINNADNADLKAAYQKQLGNIISDAGTYGQQFSADLQGRTPQIGTVLAQSYAAVFDQKAMSNQDFATRPDLVGLRTYLATRQEFMDTMKQLGISKLDFNQKIGNEHYGNEVGQFTGKGGAAVIGNIWGNFVQNLIGQNPAFANVFYRYLQSDNLSVAVEPQILQKATNMQGYQFQDWSSLDLKKYEAGQ